MKKCYILPTTSLCNANCEFCIAGEMNFSFRNNFLKIDDKFIANIQYLKSIGVKTIEITGGGEPFLNKNLPEIISVIRTYLKDSYIKIYTNGYTLHPIPIINEINISRAHWDESLNQTIMHIKKRVNLKKVVQYFSQYKSDKIRLSTPFLKGYIDSVSKIEYLLNTYGDLFDEFVFRPLYQNSPSYQKYFVDLDFSNSKVIVDKDSCDINRDTIILASDNCFYNNWNLQ